MDAHAGLIHTIVFNRALGFVRPKDVDLELFSDVTYVSGGAKEGVCASLAGRG